MMKLNVIQLHTSLGGSKYSVKSIRDDKEISHIPEVTQSFDFGTSIQYVYPILQYVFENLIFEDLKSAQQVNNIWQWYANEELLKRSTASWLNLCTHKCMNFTVLERSTNFMYDSVSFSLIFYKDIKLDKFICVHKTKKNVKMSFAKYFKKEIIPKGQDFWALCCSTVYRINVDSLHDKFMPVFSALMIPEIPNVTIRRFHSPIKTVGMIKDMLKENLEMDETLECLLVFTESNPEKSVPTLMYEILNRQSPYTIALCGGVFPRGVQVFNNDKHHLRASDQIYCVAFTQKQDAPVDFEAFSIVTQEREEFEDKISLFRRKIVLRKKSFMIRIGSGKKTQSKTEISLLKKYFPETFVVGLGANGEIGWDKFGEGEESFSGHRCTKKKLKVLLETCHRSSTALVLITWGPKV